MSSHGKYRNKCWNFLAVVCAAMKAEGEGDTEQWNVHAHAVQYCDMHDRTFCLLLPLHLSVFLLSSTTTYHTFPWYNHWNHSSMWSWVADNLAFTMQGKDIVYHHSLVD